MSKFTPSFVSTDKKTLFNYQYKNRKEKNNENISNSLLSNKFKNTMFNMNKQLSNISLGEKIIYSSRTNKRKIFNDDFINELKIVDGENINSFQICHNESFKIINTKNNYINYNYQLEKENYKLKENINFLLNKTKKIQYLSLNTIDDKNEIEILKDLVYQYEIKLKLMEEKYTKLNEENNILKEKFNDIYSKSPSTSRNKILNNRTFLSPQTYSSNFSMTNDSTKENLVKNNNDLFTNITTIKRNSSNIYIKKTPKLTKTNSALNIDNFTYEEKNINPFTLYKNNSIKKIDSKIIRLSIKNNNIPIISNSPPFLYNLPKFNFIKDKNRNEIIAFNISIQRFSIKNYIEGTSNFNNIYNSFTEHENDIILSLSNGAIIITGKETNKMFFYNSLNNYMYNLNNLNNSHCKGGIIQYGNNKLICLSGKNNSTVEIYNIKENKWKDLPNMNRAHCESSYIILNNNILFSFFGFDYEKNLFISDIEYLNLNNTYLNWKIMKINEKIYIKGHNLFSLYNHYKQNYKIFIIGGENNSYINQGIIEIELIDFKIKYLDGLNKHFKSKNRENKDAEKIIFSNPFFSYFDTITNKKYMYNIDQNLNAHIIDIDTLEHNIYKCHIFS